MTSTARRLALLLAFLLLPGLGCPSTADDDDSAVDDDDSGDDDDDDTPEGCVVTTITTSDNGSSPLSLFQVFDEEGHEVARRESPLSPWTTFGYTFDGEGRVLTRSVNGSPERTLAWSAASQIESVTFSNGAAVTYTWNLDGTLASTTDSTTTASWVHDSGRVSQIERVESGEPGVRSDVTWDGDCIESVALILPGDDLLLTLSAVTDAQGRITEHTLQMGLTTIPPVVSTIDYGDCTVAAPPPSADGSMLLSDPRLVGDTDAVLSFPGFACR